jgi:hypothetical protein
MPKRLGLAIIAAVLALSTVPLVAQNQNPLTKINDQWEMGCVSCHSPQVMGQTLNVALERGGHPNITQSVRELPNGCAMCHRDGSLAPLVHTPHYRAGLPAGAPSMPCLACHSMNPATGAAENKNAPKNW